MAGDARLRLIVAAKRFDALPLRQRLLVMTVAVLATFLACDTLLLRPLAAKRGAAVRQMRECAAALKAVNSRVTHITQAQARKLPIHSVDPSYASFRANLTHSQQASALLRELVPTQPGLKLDQFDTLPSLALAVDEQGQRHLWQHRQRLVLSGDYFAARDYLRGLESGNWRIYWESMALSSDGKGMATVTIRLSTLSEDSTWLAL